MKHAGLPAVIVLVMGCAAMAAAQTTSGAQTPHRGAATGTTARAQSAQAQSEQITLVGCLMPGADQNAAVGTTGTTGGSRSSRANATGQTFMLSNAMPGTGSSAAASASSTSAASASAPASSSYTLQGMDLTNQVGQRVEVMGVMVPEKASRSRSSRRGVAGTSGTTGADATTPRIRVTSVRMLAADCNGTDASGPSRTPASGTSSPGSSTTSPAGTSGTGTSTPTDRPDTTASPAAPPANDNVPDRDQNQDNHDDARPSPSNEAPGNNR